MCLDTLRPQPPWLDGMGEVASGGSWARGCGTHRLEPWELQNVQSCG